MPTTQSYVLGKSKCNQGECKILWLYDVTGISGKSWLARYLDQKNACIILSHGKECDLANAVNGQRLALFDFARAEQKKVSYSVIEHIKKWQSFFHQVFKSCQIVRSASYGNLIFSQILRNFLWTGGTVDR